MIKEIPRQLLHSFPVQLLFHHVKRNLPLLAVWLLFLAATFGGIGRVYGIQYLFLDPEYLNQVDFWSFFIMGLAFAILTMAFFITSYILDGHKFSFIGLLERPFLKFSLNNSIIPLVVAILYSWKVIDFQWNNGTHSLAGIGQLLAGFLVGAISFSVLTFLYFRFTNKDIFLYLAGTVDKRLRRSGLSRERIMRRWKESHVKHEVRTYLDLKLKVHDCTHLHNFHDRAAILKVFDQNHFNSVVFDLSIILVTLLLGAFMDNPVFQIPAAASVMLLFSIVIMMVGAITYWFKGWGVAFVVALFIVANMLVEAGAIRKIQLVPGMNYETKTPYTLEHLEKASSIEASEKDRMAMEPVLNNWREKQTLKKPKMVLICTSGGGQRAALWTFNALQRIDQRLQGQIMDKAFMISGASGGMIGAAYYRELYLKRRMGSNLELHDRKWLANLGKDNLNPIIFSLVVNDTFLKLSSFQHEGRSFKKDRGYMFEQSLNSNLEGIFNKNIGDYKKEEQRANIPWMLLSPTVANDGRKLYISNLPVSFMNADPEGQGGSSKIRGLDFINYFKDQDAERISMLTALRMSASFPYITPTVSLPSEPRLEIMDAGISDNFGISGALRFMQVFKDWITENTDGVILLVIRDTKKINQPRARPNASIADRFFLPISDVYNNLANMQDINNDLQLHFVQQWLKAPFHVVEVAYDNEAQNQQRASLSWHLTNREKETIIKAIDLDANVKSVDELARLLPENDK